MSSRLVLGVIERHASNLGLLDKLNRSLGRLIEI